jgi:hypothetical protein
MDEPQLHPQLSNQGPLGNKNEDQNIELRVIEKLFFWKLGGTKMKLE